MLGTSFSQLQPTLVGLRILYQPTVGVPAAAPYQPARTCSATLRGLVYEDDAFMPAGSPYLSCKLMPIAQHRCNRARNPVHLGPLLVGAFVQHIGAQSAAGTRKGAVLFVGAAAAVSLCVLCTVHACDRASGLNYESQVYMTLGESTHVSILFDYMCTT